MQAGGVASGIKQEKLAKKLLTHTETLSHANSHTEQHGETHTHYGRTEVIEGTGEREKTNKANYIYT